MLIEAVKLTVSLAIILLGAEVFTNSVEWLGRKLKLGEGAVGSVFAAVGTALPETLVPLIAIFSSGPGSAGHDVGIGAILGAPFMLATLAMLVTGLTAIIKRRNNEPLNINTGVIKRDMRFFMVVYAVAILATFLPGFTLKAAVAGALVFAYIFYAYKTIRSSMGQGGREENPAPLYLWRRSADPYLAVVLVQLAAGLGIIITGAFIFVGAVQVVAMVLGVPVLILSLIITPIATELPEKFNSIIWMSRGKDTLALGNITGAMVFQSSIIPALGIILTEWKLEPIGLISAVLAMGAIIFQYTGVAGKHGLRPLHLLAGALFYAVFIVAVIVI